MPALYFNTPFASADQMDLSRYTIMINEPLHDKLDHIRNIQEELSHHVPKDNNMHAKNIIATSFDGKEKLSRSQKRFVDY